MGGAKRNTNLIRGADRFELLVKNDGVVATIATTTTSSQMEKMVSALPALGLHRDLVVAVKTKEHNREQELLTTPWYNITTIANLLHISL